MRKIYPLILVAVVAVTLILMPAEKTLGTAIKWVYLHASFDAVGLLGFYGSALLAAVYLIIKKDSLSRWATAFWKTGTIFWAGGWIIGTVLGIVIWGGWTTAEPRNLLAPAIMLLGIGGWVISGNLDNKKAPAYTYLAGALLIWAALNFTGKVIHPLDPIGSADNVLQVTYRILFLAMALLGWEFVRKLSTRENPLSFDK